MKVRYFYLDEKDRLLKAAQRRVEAAWFDERAWDDSTGTKLLRIVSFICRNDLGPIRGYVMRTMVKDGWITEDSRERAIQAVHSAMPPLFGPVPTELPLIAKQLEGWPELCGLRQQIAVALDVPISQVPKLQFGGPLLMASHMTVAVKQAQTYFNIDERE